MKGIHEYKRSVVQTVSEPGEFLAWNKGRKSDGWRTW